MLATCVQCRSPEAHGEGQDVDESVDLEHTQEEDTEVLKGLCEEVPEEAHVWSQVRHR